MSFINSSLFKIKMYSVCTIHTVISTVTVHALTHLCLDNVILCLCTSMHIYMHTNVGTYIPFICTSEHYAHITFI